MSLVVITAVKANINLPGNAEWGSSAAWPGLEVLSISNNDLDAVLPPGFGISWQSLNALYASSAGLSGNLTTGECVMHSVGHAAALPCLKPCWHHDLSASLMQHTSGSSSACQKAHRLCCNLCTCQIPVC